MNIWFGDFNAKVGREDSFKLKVTMKIYINFAVMQLE
jgi:hypothetical protein